MGEFWAADVIGVPQGSVSLPTEAQPVRLPSGLDNPPTTEECVRARTGTVGAFLESLSSTKLGYRVQPTG